MNLIDSLKSVFKPKLVHTPEPTQTTAELVAQIHHEFATVGDFQQQQAQQLLSARTGDTFDKAERLRKIGFTQTPQVLEADMAERVKSEAEKTIKEVQYWRMHYPNYRFIPTHAINALCTKYGLVCAPISRYKGFVPEKNLAEIEQWEKTGLRKEDLFYELDGMFLEGDWVNVTGMLKTRHPYEYVKKLGFCPDLFHLEMSQEMSFDPAVVWAGEGYEHSGNNKMWFRIVTEEYQICAPSKHMDVSGLNQEGAVFKLKEEAPDPIVLKPVKGGGLMLTAWGDESTDPLVVNHAMN